MAAVNISAANLSAPVAKKMIPETPRPEGGTATLATLDVATAKKIIWDSKINAPSGELDGPAGINEWGKHLGTHLLVLGLCPDLPALPTPWSPQGQAGVGGTFGLRHQLALLHIPGQ